VSAERATAHDDWIRSGQSPEPWVERLRPGHPHRNRTVAKLHGALQRVAFHELARRRAQPQPAQVDLIAASELDELAHRVADDALASILDRLDTFDGRTRFTTWAYTFVMREVSAKMAQHQWRRRAPSRWELALEDTSDRLVPRPGDGPAEIEVLRALSTAVRGLPEAQREAFVAVAINEIPIDVVAVQRGTERGAVYTELFAARRTLRARLAAAGHTICDGNSPATPPAHRSGRPGDRRALRAGPRRGGAVPPLP
jgi:RNA polymerase sigma-70 factor, ECF subfamily